MSRKKEKVSVKSFEEYRSNPFEMGLDAFGYVDYKHKARPIEVIDTASGEVMELSKQAKTSVFISDSSKYIKLYIEAVFPVVKGFGAPAIQMLLYVMLRLRVNRDVVQIECEDFLLTCGYSLTSRKVFFEGLTGLLVAGVIAKSAISKTFYINPTLFFNGNRVNLLSAEDKAVIRNK